MMDETAPHTLDTTAYSPTRETGRRAPTSTPKTPPQPHPPAYKARRNGTSCTVSRTLWLMKKWASNKPEDVILLGTVVAYLAGNPLHYRIQPDNRNGQQGPDVHAKDPLRGRILPLHRRVAYVLDEHSGDPMPRCQSRSLAFGGFGGLRESNWPQNSGVTGFLEGDVVWYQWEDNVSCPQASSLSCGAASASRPCSSWSHVSTHYP